MSPRRRSTRHLTAAQRSELVGDWLWLSERGRPADPRKAVFFEGVEERDKAWRAHRGQLLEEWDTPFRRPRMWWVERGKERPAGNELLRLLELDALTPHELSGLPDRLTPSRARELAASRALARYPDLREAVFAYSGLLTGLTPKGIDAFLDGLPRESREAVSVTLAEETNPHPRTET